jgi:hypothetical protein
MNTITVKYWGGTGNCLFQIGAAIYYSNKLNRPFLLNEHPGFPNLKKYSPKSIGLDEEEYAKSLCDHNESDISKNVEFPEKNVLLSGFFQDYRICDEYKEYLVDVLGIPTIRKNVVSIISHPAFQSRGLFWNPSTTEITVSLHIRRGDYENLRCYFILLDEYYYKNAILYLMGKLSGTYKRVRILCFYEKQSHEPANQIIHSLELDKDLLQFPIEYYHFNEIVPLCLQNAYCVSPALRIHHPIPTFVPLFGIVPNQSITDIEEMAIMSHCDHHIIANSTYSWWSAYINEKPDKIVCYPNEWYNHQLYYLSTAGFNADGFIPIPAWNPRIKKCGCF